MKAINRFLHLMCASISVSAFSISDGKLSAIKDAIKNNDSVALNDAPTLDNLNAILEEEWTAFKKAQANFLSHRPSNDKPINPLILDRLNSAKTYFFQSIEAAGLLFPSVNHSFRIVIKPKPLPVDRDNPLEPWPITVDGEIFLQMPSYNLNPNRKPMEGLTGLLTPITSINSDTKGLRFKFAAYGENSLYAYQPPEGTVRLWWSEVESFSIVKNTSWVSFLLNLTDNLLKLDQNQNDIRGLGEWKNYLLSLNK